MYISTLDPVNCCRALGDGTRLRILRLLAASNDEACLCELECSMREPGYKLSRHLKILRQAGLLQVEKEGRWVYHRWSPRTSTTQHLYDFVLAMPDRDGTFTADLARFIEGQAKRIGGRCRGTDDNKAEGDDAGQAPVVDGESRRVVRNCP